MGEGNANAAIICEYSQDEITTGNPALFKEYTFELQLDMLRSGATSNSNELDETKKESNSYFSFSDTFDSDLNYLINSNSLNLSNIEQNYLINKFQYIEELKSEVDFWDEEEVVPPNDVSINLTKELLLNLACKKIFAYKLMPTIEEGILISFKKNDLRMYLELYNDGQIGYIVEDFKVKTIKDNKELNSIQEASFTIENFLTS